MELTHGAGWSRRDTLGTAGLVALAFGLPVAAVRFSAIDRVDAPTPAHRALFREVSQLVIPRTGTAGGGDVGAGDFALLAIAHGLEGTAEPIAAPTTAMLPYLRPGGSLRHAAWLEAELNRRAGGKFMVSSQRAAVLAALDNEAFAPALRDHPWRTIKALILTGYYTTQAGGAQELRYELVPGRWDADLPATPQTIAWSSDWTAVDFG